MKISHIAISLLMLSGVAVSKDLATVDGVKITEKDFDNLKTQVPNFDFNKLTKDQRLQLIGQKINEILIIKDIKAKKLDATPEFKQTLKAAETQAKLVAWQHYVFAQASKQKITDTELKSYYDANPDKFTQQEGQARHILVSTKEKADSIIDMLNKTKSADVLNKFSELAKKDSLDKGSAANGGDLGDFQRSQMVKSFGDAAFALKEGTYTKQPVKTEYGYHVIYLIKKSPLKIVSFEEAKEGISALFREQRANEAIQKDLQQLRDAAKIKIND